MPETQVALPSSIRGSWAGPYPRQMRMGQPSPYLARHHSSVFSGTITIELQSGQGRKDNSS